MSEQQPELKKKLRFSLFSFDQGLQVYEDVTCIRVKDEHYNLLIMMDHTPCIGELNGTITILTKDEEIQMERVKGFYMLRQNEFHFLEKGKFVLEEQEIVEKKHKEKEVLGREEHADTH